MELGEARVLTQLRRGVLESCVLALLREEPRYGFDIVRELSEADGLLTSEGTIYPLLSRLRKEGLVVTTWQPSDAGPPRRYYALTGDGRTALDRFLQDWRRFRDSVDRVLGSGSGRSEPRPAEIPLAPATVAERRH
ncbi:MAG: PadR family transcriptional regulator [Kineosporiaceae bacterium]|nr:PadR family transcriptional regulator [Kineosporiaceae bacterium]